MLELVVKQEPRFWHGNESARVKPKVTRHPGHPDTPRTPRLLVPYCIALEVVIILMSLEFAAGLRVNNGIPGGLGI